MHLLLTGATGLVGTATLHAMLHNPNVTKITIFSRSPVLQATDSTLAKEKCTIHAHTNFSNTPSLEILRSVNYAVGCVWALGVSTNAVSASEYEKITVRWPVAWARALMAAKLDGPLQQGSAGTDRIFNFVYVSGAGATATPGVMTPQYGRVKGQAEQALFQLAQEKNMGGLKIYAARAGAVDRAGHVEIAKYLEGKESLQKKLEKPIKAVLRSIWKSLMSPTPVLGNALVKLAAEGWTLGDEGDTSAKHGRILSNVDLMKTDKSANPKQAPQAEL